MGEVKTKVLRNDYSGPFDPDLGLADFSRQALAHLGREYLLNGHLQDRVGLPLVAKSFGGDAYVDFSIEEWMAASPIYSKRMQRAMGFEGNDVGTVFKNLQLDIGAPHQFMDFQFRLDRPDYGEFWLPFCGALLDVEPFGEKHVKSMCHSIEDPTFDATAAATNPRMRMRPIHRPPRSPAGRSSTTSICRASSRRYMMMPTSETPRCSVVRSEIGPGITHAVWSCPATQSRLSLPVSSYTGGSVNGTDSRFHSPQQTGTTQDSPKPSRMRQNLTNLDTRTILPI